ncbi:MAG: hypothetical protein C0467_20315 [Planctomycetaceae bacterium]|nr:hypothetical protein [Planctomycetaceae bacterium]
MFVLLALVLFADPETPTPVRRAHAHNDYEHKRPLLDALDLGFCSVEADVWLTKGELLIGHLPFNLKSERSLQKLYLDPLLERVKANGGAVHKGGSQFYLLVDVKTNPKTTYAELAKVLEGYADILTVTRDGKTETRAVTVVISGNCDREAITRQGTRYAAIDARPSDLDSDDPAHLVPWISASWSSQFKWNGSGDMPEAERARLKEFVAKAHKKGRLVRFWAAPDKTAVWRELLAADVDLINTDNLAELRAFLSEKPKK